MPTYTLQRYQERLPLVETPFEPCDDVIYLLVRVGDREHLLGGLDVYWIHGDAYGAFVDEENLERYGGEPAVAWRWTESSHERLDDPTPPAGATFARGVLVPDDLFRLMGGTI